MRETDLGPEDANTTAAAPEPHAPAPWRTERGETEGGRDAAADAGESRGRGRPRLVDWLVIAVPMVTAFAVGGYEIGGPSLWRDEAYTKDAIGRPVSQIFALLGHQDAVHGAYYILMHVIAAGAGTSVTALRFPSLCAMIIATGFTAATGRRAAALALAPDLRAPDLRAPDRRAPGAGRDRRLDIPALTGLLSGLLFATAPYMTFYAQMARSYAIETMFATIATYLLLRAYPDGRWRSWSAYGAAVALTGLFNIFGLLILAAHGVTLLLTDARGQSATGRRAGRIPLRWLAASAAAVIVLSPLLDVAHREQQQIAWLTRPDFNAIERLLTTLAGSRQLIIPFALLALAGLVAACLADNWRPLNPAAIALPWLAVPPFVLITVSFVKPVYYVRYVEFCLPALAILAGAGLVGLIRLAAGTPLGRLRLAWLPAALVIAGLAALLAGPQQAIRQTAARPDNLRLASAIVAAREQPGDVVFYIPVDMRVLGTGYPAPFLRLRDIALAKSPIASATLTGAEITSPALLKSRFTDVRRVWVVTGASNDKFPTPSTPVDEEKMALLAGMHIIGRWQAGEVMLTLYGRGP
ncbi:MAG: glycosyltransferase family 39 protein [Streptosporangiaceae bacterium]